ERKTLAVVREKLRNLTRTCDEMARTLHRKNALSGQAEVHPEILHAAESFLGGEERMRSGIQATAGSVIPAALVTALNSDIAGRVIAQVTAPVYDSVTGDHLLIPQGARLIGAYDNGVRYGEHRIVLAWDR